MPDPLEVAEPTEHVAVDVLPSAAPAVPPVADPRQRRPMGASRKINPSPSPQRTLTPGMPPRMTMMAAGLLALLLLPPRALGIATPPPMPLLPLRLLLLDPPPLLSLLSRLSSLKGPQRPGPACSDNRPPPNPHPSPPKRLLRPFQKMSLSPSPLSNLSPPLTSLPRRLLSPPPNRSLSFLLSLHKSKLPQRNLW